MSYDTVVSGSPGAVHSLCPIEECDWAPPRPSETSIRRHLEAHTVEQWTATTNYWHARAVAAEQEVTRLRAALRDRPPRSR